LVQHSGFHLTTAVQSHQKIDKFPPGAWGTTLLFCCLTVVPHVLSAQAAADPPLPSRPIVFEILPLVPQPTVSMPSQEQLDDLARWMHDFDEWQKWADVWLGRRQPGFWSNYAERNKKPDPPDWLEDTCTWLADDEQLRDGCARLVVWREDPISVKNRRAASAAQVQHEAPTKSVWWQHLHLDGMWSTTQSNSLVFGLLGAHVTVEIQGRLQIFVAPGILLMSVPGYYGTRDLWPATDWGATYRLFNVGRSTVHFNLVHAWIFGGQTNLPNPDLTLAGFSFTFRPRPH
jgi:hypothetical protein